MDSLLFKNYLFYDKVTCNRQVSEPDATLKNACFFRSPSFPFELDSAYQ